MNAQHDRWLNTPGAFDAWLVDFLNEWRTVADLKPHLPAWMGIKGLQGTLRTLKRAGRVESRKSDSVMSFAKSGGGIPANEWRSLSTLSNCWTCRWKLPNGRCTAASHVPGVSHWACGYGFRDFMPPTDATGCPGYEPNP